MTIIYQIFCAIDFIHTGTKERSPLLHLDIKSKNIVLDAKLNARLTDFGSAVELKDGDVVSVEVHLAGTPGYKRTRWMDVSREDDYHGFGVVMRELVTGLKVVEEVGKEIQKFNKDKVVEQIQRFIWTNQAVVEKVIDLSVLCLENESHYKQIRDELSKEIKEIFRKHSIKRWSPLMDDRCERCLVNRALPSDIYKMKHEMAFCCTCLRNSHVNPIICHTCEEKIKPFIGDGWGAILVAGFDADNTFVEDVRTFGSVATSTMLPSMCIQTNQLIKIIPESKSETLESIRKKIDGALERLVTKAKVHTLLFYYSGHNGENNCLQITDNCVYDLKLLPQELRRLTEQNENLTINKTIVILDCCYPKYVHMLGDVIYTRSTGNDTNDTNDDKNGNYKNDTNEEGTNDEKDTTADQNETIGKNDSTDKKNRTNNTDDTHKEITMIQINACGPYDQAEATNGGTSFFTRCIIQALTMNANGGKCSMPKCTSNCRIYDDFISVERLSKFVACHANNEASKDMKVNFINVSHADVYLAYNYHFPVQLNFKVQVTQFGNPYQPELSSDVTVGPPDCLDICLLKRRLSKKYIECLAKVKNFTSTVGSVMKTDVFCIECKSGPEKTDVKEIQEINDIPREHYLTCKLRDMEEINIKKPVGIFLQNVTFTQKALSLEEVDAFKKTLQKEHEKSFADALSVVEQRIEDLKLRELRLKIQCETIGSDGASLVSIEIV